MDIIVWCISMIIIIMIYLFYSNIKHEIETDKRHKAYLKYLDHSFKRETFYKMLKFCKTEEQVEILLENYRKSVQ